MGTPHTDTATDYAQRVMRVLLFIQQNLDRALPLEELASVACFSPFHFHRVFRGMVGESVKQHVRRLRLERAAGHLKSSDRGVLAIALDAGYETHESFTRAFGKSFGCSPTEFRNDESREGAGAKQFQPVPFENMNMKVEIREMESKRVLYLRHVGPYNEVGSAWERLCDWAGQRGLINGDTLFLGASYDDPDVTPADKLRYDACLTLPDAAADSPSHSVVGEGAIGVMELAGGRFAVALHEGAYEKLNESYAAIYGGWFAEQSFEPGPAPCVEYYLNHPEDTEPEDLLTEICVPILSV
jgi:AraC family transcriptional regulator